MADAAFLESLRLLTEAAPSLNHASPDRPACLTPSLNSTPTARAASHVFRSNFRPSLSRWFVKCRVWSKPSRWFAWPTVLTPRVSCSQPLNEGLDPSPFSKAVEIPALPLLGAAIQGYPLWRTTSPARAPFPSGLNFRPRRAARTYDPNCGALARTMRPAHVRHVAPQVIAAVVGLRPPYPRLSTLDVFQHDRHAQFTRDPEAGVVQPVQIRERHAGLIGPYRRLPWP